MGQWVHYCRIVQHLERWTNQTANSNIWLIQRRIYSLYILMDKSPLVIGFVTVIGLTWLGHGSNINSCICVDLDLEDQLRLWRLFIPLCSVMNNFLSILDIKFSSSSLPLIIIIDECFKIITNQIFQLFFKKFCLFSVAMFVISVNI